MWEQPLISPPVEWVSSELKMGGRIRSWSWAERMRFNHNYSNLQFMAPIPVRRICRERRQTVGCVERAQLAPVFEKDGLDADGRRKSSSRPGYL